MPRRVILMGLPEFRLDDAVVLVTGAGRGIGRAIALDAAESGATVVACSRSEIELASLRKEIEQKSGECHWVVVDIASAAGPKTFVDFAVDTCGRVDALVNNAGTNLLKEAVDYTSEEVQEI